MNSDQTPIIFLTMKNPDIILTHEEIQRKVTRIAWQIYETFVADDTIVIAGIAGNGYVFAEKLAAALHKIAPLKIELCRVVINKQQPSDPVQTSLEPNDYSGKGIVLVDDVLHSGATLIYGVRHFLDVPLKKFKTAVLIDRNHKQFPIKADFKGISLSTSLQEHVEVVFSVDGDYAYLS